MFVRTLYSLECFSMDAILWCQGTLHCKNSVKKTKKYCDGESSELLNFKLMKNSVFSIEICSIGVEFVWFSITFTEY
jgi:hypothetical protein